MVATRLSLKASQLPDNLRPGEPRLSLVRRVGFAAGVLAYLIPPSALWLADWDRIVQRHPAIAKMLKNIDRTWAQQLATLGGGNHFDELCLDENQEVWSCCIPAVGVATSFGRYFIELARRIWANITANLPDRRSGLFTESAAHFNDYVEAVQWAQDYAMTNRH